jgi:hypothetical protein
MQATPISIVPLHLRYRGAPDAEPLDLSGLI